MFCVTHTNEIITIQNFVRFSKLPSGVSSQTFMSVGLRSGFPSCCRHRDTVNDLCPHHPENEEEKSSICLIPVKYLILTLASNDITSSNEDAAASCSNYSLCVCWLNNCYPRVLPPLSDTSQPLINSGWIKSLFMQSNQPNLIKNMFSFKNTALHLLRRIMCWVIVSSFCKSSIISIWDVFENIFQLSNELLCVVIVVVGFTNY